MNKHYNLLVPPLMVLCNSWCIRGPRAPNKWDGKPLASSKALMTKHRKSSLKMAINLDILSVGIGKIFIYPTSTNIFTIKIQIRFAGSVKDFNCYFVSYLADDSFQIHHCHSQAQLLLQHPRDLNLNLGTRMGIDYSYEYFFNK